MPTQQFFSYIMIGWLKMKKDTHDPQKGCCLDVSKSLNKKDSTN
jgi:hypothetical protein